MGEEGVVADGSVLIVFARADLLGLLHRAVGKVSITGAVRDEAIRAAPHRPDAVALARAEERRELVELKVDVRRVQSVLRAYPNLGRGEASVIAAALQHGRTTVLMDERTARRAALLEGLSPVGSLGILARARHRGVVRSTEELATALRAVLAAGLWVAPEVVEEFWAAVDPR